MGNHVPTTGDRVPTMGKHVPTVGKCVPTTGKCVPTAEMCVPAMGKHAPTTEKRGEGGFKARRAAPGGPKNSGGSHPPEFSASRECKSVSQRSNSESQP